MQTETTSKICRAACIAVGRVSEMLVVEFGLQSSILGEKIHNGQVS